MYFLDLIGHVTRFVNLTIVVGTINTSLFLLWQVSIEWPVLPQLVQVNVDLTTITNTTNLTTTLVFSVVKKTL
jgi:hypothetical protein